MTYADTPDFRSIVNSLPDPLLLVGDDFTIRFANLAFYRLFNRTEAGTLGHSLFTVQAGLWASADVRPLLEAVLAHDVVVNRVRLEETFPVVGRRLLEMGAHRISHDGLPGNAIIVTLQDVTGEGIANEVAQDRLVRSRAMITEVNHRVKNNLASIRSMVRVEARNISDPGSRDILERIGLRIESMASLYELLTVGEVDGAVEILPYFNAICDAVARISGDRSPGWSIEVTGEPLTVTPETALALGAIVNELVTNAAKYAFHGTQDIGTIRVTGERCADGYTVRVADNGCGIDRDDADPKSTGMGMRLVEVYARSLGTRVERASSPEGTTCHLSVPWSHLVTPTDAPQRPALALSAPEAGLTSETL